MEPSANSDPHSMETIALIQGHRNGKQGAMEELFRRYEKRVRRIVQIRMGTFLRARADVDDVVQDTMLRAFTSFDSFEIREDAKLINWMARLAENALRDLNGHHRRDKRDAGLEVPIAKLRGNGEGDSMAWDLESPSVSPVDKVATGEIEKVVDECMQELSEEDREIILLVDIAGGDWDYVVEQTARPNVEAAQKFHRRARIKLAGMVGRRTS